VSGSSDVKVKGYVDVAKDDNSLKEAVGKAPVSVAVAANYVWQFYFGGVVSDFWCPEGDLDHGVVLVGYSDS